MSQKQISYGFEQLQSRSMGIMAALSAVFVLTFFLIDYYNIQTSIEEEKRSVHQQVVQLFESETQKLVSFYSTRVKCHLAAPEAVSAMERGDHEAIYLSAKPKFDILNAKNPYVTHMHFYAPDGTSLMRVHNKDVYGDDIASKRPMVAYAVKNQVGVSGFEEGYFGLIFRVVEPAYNKQGEYIGSLEFGFQPEYFETVIKGLFPDLKVALTIPKSNLKLYQDNGQFELYKGHFLIGSDVAAMKAFLPVSNSELGQNETVDFKGQPHLLINDIVLKDFEGEPFIQMVLLKDISQIYAEFDAALVQSALLGLLLLALMVMASRYVLGYYTHKATLLHKELEESHAKMEAVFNTSGEGLALLDRLGKIVEANPAFCQILGEEKFERLNGLGIDGCVDGAYRRTFESGFKGVIQGQEYNLQEIKAKTLDGQKLWLELSMAWLDGEEHVLLTCRDVTRLRRQQLEIEQYVALLDENVVTSKTDLHGTITYVSQAFCDISGYSKEELLGQNHSIVRHADMPAEIYEVLWETIQSGQVWKGEIKNRRKNGGYYWVAATISPERNDRGELIGYTAIRHDITDKKRIEELSITDELTGLYNRRYYNEVFDVQFNQRKRDHLPFLFVLIDVDFFKRYNDNYGHQMGDIALQSVSKALKEAFQRNADFVFRLGGEEFGAILHVDGEVAAVLDYIHEAVAALKIPHEVSAVNDNLTVSVGACLIENYLNEVDEKLIYKLADQALYRSKETGRNRSTIERI